VASNAPNIGPDNQYRTSSICQTDNKQLVSEANFRAVYDQSKFSDPMLLFVHLLPSKECIPFPDMDYWITQHFSCSRNLYSNSSQANRTTLMNTNNQPGGVTDTSDPLIWLESIDTCIPGMKEFVDWYNFIFSYCPE